MNTICSFHITIISIFYFALHTPFMIFRNLFVLNTVKNTEYCENNFTRIQYKKTT